MRAHLGAGRTIEFEAFGTSVGIAMVCGALSVILPTLSAAVGTLSALAVASWVALVRQGRLPVYRAPGSSSAVALAALGGCGALYLDPPGPLLEYRGLLLAIGLVPLLLVERRRSTPRAPVFVSP